MALSPFDVLNAINFTKENIFETEDINKNYNSFIINRGLSYFPDTLFHANEMDKYSDIPKQWQFDYYMNVIHKKNRFSKWAKPEGSTDDLECVKLYYNYSNEKAIQALSILTEDQLVVIRQSQYKGGKV